MKHKLILLVAFCFGSYFSKAQTVELEDLFRLHTMDSVEFKAFCDSNGFVLMNVSVTKFRTVHEYKLATDDKIRLSKNFPASSDNYRGVSYFFSDKKEYKKFKDAVKAAGFKFVKKYDLFPIDHPKYSTRERFHKDDLELELSTTNMEPSRHVLSIKYQPDIIVERERAAKGN